MYVPEKKEEVPLSADGSADEVSLVMDREADLQPVNGYLDEGVRRLR